MLDLKKWLVKVQNLLVILLPEVLDHRNCGASLSLLELTCGRTHVKTNAADLVRLVMAVAGHYDGSFEFVVDRFLYFFHCRRLVRVALSLFSEAPRLFVDQFQTVIDR